MNEPRLRFKEFRGGLNLIPLGKITETITSGSRDWAQFYSKDGSKFIRMTNLSRDGINLKLDDLKFVNIKSNSKDGNRTSLIQGDILISITAELGKIGWIPPSFGEAFINQHTALVRIDKAKAESKYVAYLLSTPKLNKQINRKNDAGAKAGLNLPTIKSIKIQLPELIEQTKIANFLSAVDEKVTQLTKKCDFLAQYKKGVMQQIFSQQLRFKDDDGRNFPDWEQTNLGSVADPNVKWSLTGGPFGSNLKAEDYKESGIRIIQLQNIGDGNFLDSYKIYTSVEKANQLLSCNIYPGEIIISKMGDPVARCCIMPFNQNRYLMASDGIRLVVNKSLFNTKYIHDYINFEDFRKNAIEASTGSTRKRIGLDELKKLLVNYPCLLEQTKIANLFTAIDDKINSTEAQLAAVKQFKQGLLQQMFV